MILQDSQELKRKLEQFKLGGKENFHVLADFDRTLTRAVVNGKKIMSLMDFFRSSEDYISKEYSEKSHALANIYRPIEIDPNVPLEEKKGKMLEWWTKHFDLLIKSGLNKEHISLMLDNSEKLGFLEFREGVFDFLDTLYHAQIPLIIISSSGLGFTIKMFLERNKKYYSNLYIITNDFEWDEEDNAIRIKEPIIHVMNKDETSVKNFPEIYEKIKARKNVLLLGDSLGDLGMVKGFRYENLISVGFLEEDNIESMQKYKSVFDIVLTDDANFNQVNKILEEVVGK